MSNVFEGVLKFLGIEFSPAFARASEGHGRVERFISTLKKAVLGCRPSAPLSNSAKRSLSSATPTTQSA